MKLRVLLPCEVSKASGLSEAVWRLGASLHNGVAIGAAEDDQPMLDVCEIGAAGAPVDREGLRRHLQARYVV